MPTKPHRASDYLKTPEDVAAYLNATLDELDDPRLLMKAFRNVAEACGSGSPPSNKPTGCRPRRRL